MSVSICGGLIFGGGAYIRGGAYSRWFTVFNNDTTHHPAMGEAASCIGLDVYNPTIG